MRRSDSLLGALYLIGLGPPLVALLLVLVSVRTPPILAGGGFAVPPQFDGEQAIADATTLARLVPDRSPGSPTAATATQTVSRWLARASGVRVQSDRFLVPGPDGPVELVNLVAVVPGQSEDAIVLLAHRDNRAPGPGANDNASGTAVLVQLARTFAPLDRTKTLVLASVDGGTLGHLGARRLAERPPNGVRPVAAIALDAVGAADGSLPILFAGNDGRRSAAGLPRAAIQALETGGVPAEPPAVGTQVLELLQPALAEGAQAPFVDRGVSAIQIGDGGDVTGPQRIARQRLERVGLALDTLVQRLDTTPESAGSVDAYVMLGERALPAWVLALAASLLVSPALVAGGLLVRAPGARVAWWPALVTVGRVALPLVGAVAAVRLAAAVGLLPDTPWVPRGDEVGAGAVLLLLAGAAAGLVAAWRVPHPPRQAASEEAPALLAVTLATAVAGAALVLVGNPPTALLLIPALHAWALLPLLAGAGAVARVLVLVVPAVTTFALFLGARGASPGAWLEAIAAREVPGAVAVGLALALAAALTAVPVVAGLLRERSPTEPAADPQRSGT